MNTEKRTCAECGAEVAEDAPRGLCPQCLMREGLESGGGSAVAVPSEAATVVRPSELAVGGGPGGREPAGAGEELDGLQVGKKVRYFGDYELLEEIARGGMGVVYKARQASLNRIVALKMILAGQFATEAEVRRFRVEAEAAANLQHPNIVAIHEVGVHEGRHYFSMDCVAGKNLAQVAGGKPLPASQAAGLLKTIAEAVHYAHQRGTFHRDLKPQNVLIDEEGRPRITDFGLAKRMEQDSSLTRSGAVLGSPSYMPPEQASGRSAEMGPQSDVYSLGAILYELLTGRAPFQRETLTATLVQVLEEEPVAPRKWNAGVPMDLETICLKCLEKRPERRYASARALAEELERFLNHEPIMARPASPWRKGWSWLQKHPWAIAGVAALVIVGLACTAYGTWQAGRYQLWQTTHPDTVFRPGFQPLLITAWLGFTLLLWPCGWAERRLRDDFRRHREQGAPIPGTVAGAAVFMGAGAMIYGLAMLFKVVELWAWRPRLVLAAEASSVAGMGIMPLCTAVMCLLWGGALLVWKGVGASELSVFSGSVAQAMAAADAREDELSRRRALKTSRKERVFSWAAPLLLFAIMIALLLFLVALAGSLDRTDVGSLKLEMCLAGVGSWLVPAWALWGVQGEGPARARAATRAVLAAAAVVTAWGLHALALGALLGLALALGGASLGVLAAATVARAQRLEAQERRQVPDASRKRASLAGGFFASGGKPTVANMLAPVAVTVLLGVATFQTWRNAALDFACLEHLATSGKMLPPQSYTPARVPDAVNFAKTPLLQALGTQKRLETDRWARLAAFEALGRSGQSWRLQPRFATSAAPATANAARPDRRAGATELLRALAPLEADLEELRLAVARPYAQVDPPDLDGAAQDRNRPHFPAYRLLAGLLAAHAAAELELGRSSAAWRDARVVQRLSDSLSANLRLETTLFRAGLVQTCQETFWEGWVAGRWTAGDLREWEKWLSQVDFLRDLALSLRGAELSLLNRVFDGASSVNQSVPFFLGYWYQDQRCFNQLLVDYCDGAFDPARRRIYPTRALALQERIARTLEKTSRHWQVASFHFPNLEKSLPRLAHVQSLVDLSRVAAALALYRLDTREYPPRLEDLAPRYLPQVPHDLVSGKPPIYRRTAEDEITLYSIGWNERDDGGVPPADLSDSQHGDWVWPTETGAGH